MAKHRSHLFLMDDLVSVIIPSFNRYALCCRAVESVLAQTHSNIEIIVVNDASTETDYKLKGFAKYPKTYVVHLEKNMRALLGVNAAQGATRDVGIAVSRGKWIAFLDDDDVWLPQKLELQLLGLAQLPEVLFSCTNYFKDEPPYNPEKHKTAHYDLKEHIVLSEYTKVVTSSVLLHRKIIEKVGRHTIGTAEDHIYWAFCLQHTPILFIAYPLIVYDNVHTGGLHYKYDY